MVYAETDTTILFYFESNTGPPTYATGSIYGRLKITTNTANYINHDRPACESVFDFRKVKLILKTDPEKTDCGFGHKVFLHGTFKKRSGKQPAAFIDLEGCTYFFNKTPPEDYNTR